jgi:ribosomal protein S27AE
VAENDDAARLVTGWVKLGDKVAGVKSLEARCDGCGAFAYLSPDGPRHVCARCYLERGSVTS